MLFLIINKKQLQHRSELRCMRDQIKTSLITKKVRRIKFGANSPKKTCNLNELWLLISNMNKSSEGISFRGNLYFEGQNWNILEDIWNIKKYQKCDNSSNISSYTFSFPFSCFFCSIHLHLWCYNPAQDQSGQIEEEKVTI